MQAIEEVFSTRVKNQVKKHEKTLKKVCDFYASFGRLPKRKDNKHLGYWCANVRSNPRSYNEKVYECLKVLAQQKGIYNVLFGYEKENTSLNEVSADTADIINCIKTCEFITSKDIEPDTESKNETEREIAVWLVKKRYLNLKNKSLPPQLVAIANYYSMSDLFE